MAGFALDWSVQHAKAQTAARIEFASDAAAAELSLLPMIQAAVASASTADQRELCRPRRLWGPKLIPMNSMSIADLLVPEFDHEIAITREVLKRVPDNRGEWKPHPKSFPMAHLAQLVARLPGWVPMMLDRNELDIQPTGGSGFPGYSIEKTATLLAEFDKNADAARAALAAATDESLQQPWTLKKAGKVMYTDSRYQMLRSMVLNHQVHHRAQLAMYLRLTEQKVPEMYGPTADK